MGLNAYFAFTVCGDLAAKGVTDPWKIALAAVLAEGIVFVFTISVQFQRKAGQRCACQSKIRHYGRY